jgi:hypothetical protein
MTDLAPQIAEWLLAQPGWVSATDLCARFGIDDDRQLRCIGEVPGLISEFAISHTRKGFRHVKKASTLEWLVFKFSLMRHAISVIRRVKRLARVRHNVFLPTTPPTEKDSGQTLFTI